MNLRTALRSIFPEMILGILSICRYTLGTMYAVVVVFEKLKGSNECALIATELQIFYHGHSDLGHKFNNARLNLAQVNPLAADLDLRITSTQNRDSAIGVVSHQVSTPIHSASRSLGANVCSEGRICDKSRCSLDGVVAIPTGDLWALDNKLSHCTDGHKSVVVVSVHDPVLDAADGSANVG
ncbi:hypothetical protein HG530_008054 [Fusarium avenaceum]|nr:hypothetical protein HG530_008054 [Fusarium avenaceum]